MEFELKIIEFLQKLRSPVTDRIFMTITLLGEETVFIGICIALYWCYDKRFAILFAFNYFVAAISVNLIKNTIKRPRPYTVIPEYAVGARTEGYSFPSGHTQSAASMASALAAKGSKSKYGALITALCVIWVVLVGASRMYLGQHYLSDVLVGGIIGVVVSLIIFVALSKFIRGKEDIVLWITVPVIIALMAVFNNNYGAHKYFFVAGGAIISVALGYAVEKRYIKYDVRQELWYIQLIKVIIGGSVAIAIKEGLKLLFKAAGFNPFWADFIRYFALGLWVSLGALALFKYGLGALKKRMASKKYKEGS